MLELALVENIQRADLNPLEEAAAYQQLTDAFGLTQQEIADKVGKNRVSVANALRLLRLPDFCRGVLAGGQISEGHARALLGLEEDEEMMRRALKAVLKQHLSVRQTEELVRRLRASPLSSKATRTRTPEARALEQEFAQALGHQGQSDAKQKGRTAGHPLLLGGRAARAIRTPGPAQSTLIPYGSSLPTVISRLRPRRNLRLGQPGPGRRAAGQLRCSCRARTGRSRARDTPSVLACPPIWMDWPWPRSAIFTLARRPTSSRSAALSP